MEYEIGVAGNGGNPIRYLRAKSSGETKVPRHLSFSKAQPDRNKTFDCILGPLLKEEQAGGSFYQWYALESVLIDTDHTPALVRSMERETAKVDYLSMMSGIDLPESEENAYERTQCEV